MDTTLLKLTAHKFNAERFYLLLFTHAPDLRKMFPDDMSAHNQLFTESLLEIVEYVDDFEISLKGKIKRLGRRHSALYGVNKDLYPVAKDVFLTSLDLESDAQRDSWSELYDLISRTMLEGAKGVRNE